MAIQGTCGVCKRNISVTPSSGNCTWCSSRLAKGMSPLEVQNLFKKAPPKRRGWQARKDLRLPTDKQKIPVAPKQHYPVKSMIPIWTTSDGNEFGQEIDALRHELELVHKAMERK